MNCLWCSWTRLAHITTLDPVRKQIISKLINLHLFHFASLQPNEQVPLSFKPTTIPSTAFSPFLALSGTSFTEVWDSLLFCSSTKNIWKCLWKRAFLYNSASNGWDNEYKRWWNPSLKHTTPNKWGVNGRRDALNPVEMRGLIPGQALHASISHLHPGKCRSRVGWCVSTSEKNSQYLLSSLCVQSLMDEADRQIGQKKCSKRMGGSGQSCRFPHWTCRNGSRRLLLKSFY